MHDRISAYYEPSCDIRTEPTLKLSANITLQLFDLRTGLWRTADHICRNQVRTWWGIPLTHLAQHDDMVQGTSRRSISVKNQQGTIDGRPVSRVIKGCGPVPLDQVSGWPVASILVVQK